MRWQLFEAIGNLRFKLWTDFSALRRTVSDTYWFSLLSHIFFAVILLSQTLFGIFPVSGLRHGDSSQLSFKYKSILFIYTLLVQCGIVLMFTTSIYKQLNSRIEYTKVGTSCKFNKHAKLIYLMIRFHLSFAVKFIFFFLNFLVYFNFTMVARKWPKFVSHWENAERQLTELRVIQLQDIRVKRRIKKIFIGTMFLAFSKYTFLLPV